MPPPIPSLPTLPYPMSKLQHGWQVNHSGDITLQWLHQDQWTTAMKEKLQRLDDIVAECINIPHWEEHYLGEMFDVSFWQWSSHPSVMLAGLMYPPGAIKFYVPMKVHDIQGQEYFLQS